MKAGLYIRISTGEQSNYSLAGQEQELRKYCKEQGLEAFKVYSDTKGRFTFEERQSLMLMLDDVEKGKIKLILCTELDRLAGEEGILGYIRYTIKKNGVKLISINEKDKVSNELQELTDSILTAIAKFENKRKKDRCRRGIAKAREKGKILNRCPYGYRFEKGSVVIDPEKSKKVVKIFDRFINKDSIYKIAKDLNIPKSNVKYILKNKFYYDPEHTGKHETIIDKETFEKTKPLNM